MRRWTSRLGLAFASAACVALAHSPAAVAADAVRGKLLYEVTNGAPLACANSGCHGTNVALNKNKILRGANNGPLIVNAITKNAGGMGFLAAYVNSVEAADIGAYIADPAAGTAAPAASVAPASLAFAATVVGSTSASQSATLSNPGTAALSIGSLTIVGANAADFAIVAGGSCAAGASVQPGSSCSIVVRFQPGAAGARAATLSISHNATGAPSSIALSGTATVAPQPAVSVSANALAFASTALGTLSPAQTVTVANVGGASLTFTDFGLSGAQAAEFSRPPGVTGGTCATGTALAAGASCTVGLAFAPAALGTRSATLTIASNAANGNPMITLSGTGSPAPAPVAQLSAPTLAFGDQTVGVASTARQVVLANTGNAPMAIASVAVVGPTSFAITANACGAALAPGASCAIDLAFTAAEAGAATATLRVSDDAAGSPHTVALSANGVAGPVAAPTLTPSTAADFGETQVGQRSAARQVTIGNAGSAAFTIAALAIGGADASSFAIEPGGCVTGQAIAPAGSCVVPVAFAPAAIGTKVARLEFAASSGSQFSVDLLGSGLAVAAPAIDTGATVLDFGTQAIDRAAARALTLTNTGTAVLQVSSITVSGPFAIDTASSQCPPVPFALGPGTGCQLVVTFNPIATGKQSGQVSIASNAGPAPKSVALAGTADAAPISAPLNLGAGGCASSHAAGPVDPVLPMLALLPAVALVIRRRPPSRPGRASETGDAR